MAAAGVDVVCLVRGGGARTDLAAFDAEAVARAVAALPVPVLTGIGHEIDTSVADEVAWQRHVTPTACAAWLVDRAQRWCERRDEVFAGCLAAAEAATGRAQRRLDRRAGRVAGSARHHVRSASAGVDAAGGPGRRSGPAPPSTEPPPPSTSAPRGPRPPTRPGSSPGAGRSPAPPTGALVRSVGRRARRGRSSSPPSPTATCGPRWRTAA